MKVIHTLFFIVLSIGIIHGQYINKHSEGRQTYKVQEDIFKYKDMGDIFIQHEQAYKDFNKALRNKKAAKIWGYASLGTMLSGTIVTAAVASGEDYCDLWCNSDIIAGFTIVLSSISGTVAILHAIRSNKKRKSSINTMNRHQADRLGNTSLIEYDIIIGSNGVGLTMNF